MSSNSHKQQPKRKRDRPEVQVVSCPPAFPISKRKRPDPTPGGSARALESVTTASPQPNKPQPQAAATELLDWHETAKEVRNYGAKAFEGQQKRNYKDEQYRLLTGRSPKKQRVPLPIVRGIRKAAEKREKKALEEARQAGIVLPKSQSTASASKRKDRADRTSQMFGPAPSIGSLHKGILKLKGKPK